MSGSLRTLMRATGFQSRQIIINYDGITAPGGVVSVDPPPSAVIQKQRVKDTAAQALSLGRNFYTWKCMFTLISLF